MSQGFTNKNSIFNDQVALSSTKLQRLNKQSQSLKQLKPLKRESSLKLSQ